MASTLIGAEHAGNPDAPRRRCGIAMDNVPQFHLNIELSVCFSKMSIMFKFSSSHGSDPRLFSPGRAAEQIRSANYSTKEVSKLAGWS